MNCACEGLMINELFDDMFQYKLRSQELIFLFWIMQAVVTEHHEQAGVANSGKRDCKGMRQRNTRCITMTLYVVKTTPRHGVMYIGRQ